jgi:uncharacterized protein (DUF1697 family)
MMGRMARRLTAFLRAINVGGHNVTMEALRGYFEALGFTGVETFIASGNVIFTSSSKDQRALEKKIEARLRTALGYEVTTFIRSDAEVAAIAGYKPFTEAQMRHAGALCVGLVAEPLGPAAARALMTFKTDIDDFHVHGREVYWLCAKKQSESTFSNASFERALKVRATFRGVNTVSRLAARHGFSPQPNDRL